MELPDLLSQFKALTESAKDVETLKDFMMSTKCHIEDYFASLDGNENIDRICYIKAANTLSEIADDLRSQVPLEAQLKSERIIFPKSGQVNLYYHHPRSLL